MEIFDKIRQTLRFLVECLSLWIAMGGRDSPVQGAKRLITTAVFEHDVIVYVKGHEKRTWNLLLDDERRRIYIETLDIVRKTLTRIYYIFLFSLPL